MFIVAVALIAFGYTAVYYGGSLSKAFKALHNSSTAMDPNSKGGIPFGILLGVAKAPTSGSPTPEQQAFPPFVTGTWGETGEGRRPRGQ